MRSITLTIFAIAAFQAHTAWASSIILGPAFDEITGNGYFGSATTGGVLSGVAVGNAEKRENFSSKGGRVVMWDSDSNVIEFESLWSLSNGDAESSFRSINSSKITVGVTKKFAGNTDLGQRPIRWDASGNATELEVLGVSSIGKSFAEPMQINSSGFVAGIAEKYVGEHDSNLVRAVRWNPDGSIVQLGLFGDIDTDNFHSRAFDMNDSNVVVGEALKPNDVLGFGVRSAARWDINGSIVELETPGVAQFTYAESTASAINNLGDSVGHGHYSADFQYSQRPMRWDAGTTEAVPLELLSNPAAGNAYSVPYDINDSKTSVGWAMKTDANDFGQRPVRWDANGNVTELGNLGLHPDGYTEGIAFHINNAGIAAGIVNSYDALGNSTPQPCYWGIDGVAVPLSTLVDPSSGWIRILEIMAISDDNWISAVGHYDPPGPAGVYPRGFMIQVPEPTIGGSMLLMSLMAMRQQRK